MARTSPLTVACQPGPDRAALGRRIPALPKKAALGLAGAATFDPASPSRFLLLRLAYFRARPWYWVFQLLGWFGFWATQVQASGLLRLVGTHDDDLHLEVSYPGHLSAAPESSARHPTGGYSGGYSGGLSLANTRQHLRALYGEAACLSLLEQPAGTVVARLDVPAVCAG